MRANYRRAILGTKFWWPSSCYQRQTLQWYHRHVEKHTVTKSQDGGCCHLGFRRTAAIFVLIKFSENVTILVQNALLMLANGIVTKSQDGDCCHLGFRENGAISIQIDRSSQNLVGMSRIRFRTHPRYVANKQMFQESIWRLPPS